MIYTANDLRGFDVSAKDGKVGDVDDVLFDDQEWGVRYVVVDTGNWLPGRLVILRPGPSTEIATDKKVLSFDLTTESIEKSPSLSADAPVSQEKQVEIHEYFAWPPYWGGGEALLNPMRVSPAAVTRETSGEANDDAEPLLRSAKEVHGYAVQAEDGEIGHIEDLLVDDDGWVVRYFIVDTRNWLPGKKTLVAPDWLARIDYAKQSVVVDLTREEVKNSEEFDPDRVLDREYEKAIYEKLGRRPYWE